MQNECWNNELDMHQKIVFLTLFTGGHGVDQHGNTSKYMSQNIEG